MNGLGGVILQEYLTLAEIARQLNLPESTARYYKNKFSAYIPSYGSGRKKRYSAEAVEVLRLIAEMFNRNATAHQSICFSIGFYFYIFYVTIKSLSANKALSIRSMYFYLSR